MTSTISGTCQDNHHAECNGNTQDAAGHWVYCQCPAAGCTCATLRQDTAHGR